MAESKRNSVVDSFLMCSLLLASAIVFLQTIINLLLLKNDYKFHSFRYDFAAWFSLFLILLSGDTETNPSPKPLDKIQVQNLWTKFFNLSLEFKQYFSPQLHQNFSSDCLRFSP